MFRKTTFLILLLWSFPCLSTEKPLIAVILGGEGDEDFAGLQAFKSHLDSQSQLGLGMKIYTNGQICQKPNECIHSMQSGIIDIFMVSTGALSAFFPEIQVLDIP